MSHSVPILTTRSQRTQQNLPGLLEAVPDAMVVMNQDGKIIVVNTQAEKMFAYRREELLGQSIELLMPERFRDRHREHRRKYLAQPKMRPMGVGLELYGRRKDGSEFAVEISLNPVQFGEERMIVSAIRAVTDRKQKDEALRGSEERILVALKASPIIVFNQDRELRYTWTNWTGRDLRGYTDADIVAGEEGARLMAIKQGVLDSGIGTNSEVTVTSQGETRYFNLTVEPLCDTHGAVIGITGAAVDVTPLKQVAAERDRLIEELQEALAGVKLLSGLLPMCAGCKRIRDKQGAWHPIESYIASHSEAEFSHGMCEECLRKFGWAEPSP